MKKNSFSFSSLMHNNKFVLIFSIVTSIIIWFAVTYSVKTPETLVIPNIPIVINTENIPHLETLDIDIIGEHTHLISAEVEISRHQRKLINSSDFIASVDLASITAPGTYSIKVNVIRDPESEYNFTIKKILPENLKLSFDRIKTIPVVVTPRVVGAGAPEGLRVDTAVLAESENATVSVKGPENIVNQITEAFAEAVVNKTLESTETFSADIVLYNSNGDIVPQNDLTLSFSKANVTVPISQQKTVPIVATFTNVPDAYKSKAIPNSLSVNVVTISGPPDLIDTMTQVDLEPIDFGKITPNNNRFTQKLNPPSGVKVVDQGVESVRVTINSRNFISKTFTVTQFKFIGLTSGKSAQAVTSLNDVVISGPRESVNKIQASNITAEVNLTDKPGSGEYEVIANIRISGITDVWANDSSSGKHTIFVKIS